MRAACLALGITVVGCAPQSAPPVDETRCRLTFSDAGQVRVFVVGHKLSLDEARTYDDFDHAFRRHMAKIAPCISRARPNLVVFPEDSGLTALLMGSRARLARGAGDSGTAFLQAALPHLPGILFYSGEYAEISTARALLLSASDGVWRAMERTFSRIAKEHGVWVLTSANVGVMRKTHAPRISAAVRDPDLPPAHGAYVATSRDVFNTGFLWDPDGHLAGRTDKVFLTDPEEQTLDLSNGSFDGLRALETPFARIGIAISRDAFYAPFMQRLDDLDVNLVVQPEAWSGWTIQSGDEDSWLPDVFLASGWLHTQKYASIRHSLAPQLTGNFYELPFDGQVHITQKLTPLDLPFAYVGQDPLGGFLGVGPWVLDDTRGPLRDRRRALRERGNALLDDNAMIDSLLGADLELTPVAHPIVRSDAVAPSRPVSPSRNGRQRHVDAAAVDENLVVAWQDARDGIDHIRWVVTGPDAVDEMANAAEHAQRNPAVCTRPGGEITIVWQEGAPGAERIFATRAWGVNRFEAPVQVAPDGEGAQWDPDCAYLDDGTLLVTWSDLRSGVSKIRAAHWLLDADGFSPSIAVDDSSSSLPRLGSTQAQSALASGGHVVWLDYRNRSWDVFHARFDGTGFSSSQRIDGAGDDTERLHGEPDVVSSGDRVVVAWTDLHGRRAHSDIAFVTSEDGGLTWSAHRAIPGGADATPSGFDHPAGLPRFRPHLSLDGDAVTAVFSDLAPHKSAIMEARIPLDGSEVSVIARVDETGASPVSLTRPRRVVVDGKRHTFWEDDRAGETRIHTSVR